MKPSNRFQLLINNLAIAVISLLLIAEVAKAETRQGLPRCRVTTNYDTCGRTK